MIPRILPSEVLQWYLICTLTDPIFILLVESFIPHFWRHARDDNLAYVMLEVSTIICEI